MQCKIAKCLECLLLLSHFLTKIIFPEGMGGVQNSGGNSRGLGGGGYFSGQKMEIPRRRGGGLREIPSMVRVWIFSGTTHLGLKPGLLDLDFN